MWGRGLYCRQGEIRYRANGYFGSGPGNDQAGEAKRSKNGDVADYLRSEMSRGHPATAWAIAEIPPRTSRNLGDRPRRETSEN